MEGKERQLTCTYALPTIDFRLEFADEIYQTNFVIVVNCNYKIQRDHN